MIYSQWGVLQFAATRVDWTGGLQGAWGEWSALYCMPHENIMNRSQRPNSQHTDIHTCRHTQQQVQALTGTQTDNKHTNTPPTHTHTYTPHTITDEASATSVTEKSSYDNKLALFSEGITIL